MSKFVKSKILLGLTVFLSFMCCFIFVACKEIKLKVNFIVDDEIYATIDTNGKEALKLPDEPTKNGYTFDGWYLDDKTWEEIFDENSFK